jgi:hypothetical protein
MSDTSIQTLNSVVASAMAVAGVVLTLWPPQSGLKKLSWICIFLAMAGVALYLTREQGRRAAKSQEEAAAAQAEAVKLLQRINAQSETNVKLAEENRGLAADLKRQGEEGRQENEQRARAAEADRRRRAAISTALSEEIQVADAYLSSFVMFERMEPQMPGVRESTEEGCGKWDQRVWEYIEKELGPGYAIRYRSQIAYADAPIGFPYERLWLFNRVRSRKQRLEEFIRELESKQ